MRIHIYITIFLLPLFSSAQIKKTSSISLANTELGNYRYAYAIPFYKSHLKEYPTDSAALVSLAYCYKISNQYDSSFFYYKKTDSLYGLKNNNLAEIYANFGYYSKAISTYDKLMLSGISEVNKKLYSERLDGFNNLKLFQKDSLNIRVYNLKINTVNNEMNAVPYKNGLVFESDRSHKINSANEFEWNGSAFSKLYYLTDTQNIRIDSQYASVWHEKIKRKAIPDYTTKSINDNKNLLHRFSFDKDWRNFEDLPLFSIALDQRANYGAIAFTENEKICFFTESENKARGSGQLAIFQATQDENGVWSKNINWSLKNKMYSFFHPAVSNDGNRLYFASDQSGGLGGTDIYYVEKELNGVWGKKPINAGNIINTSANELFPTCYEGALFFSSNGHQGLGGLDIYKYEEKYLSHPQLVNLGYPINSDNDDFAYSIKDSKGYFSSNRFGSDDIFSFDFNKFMLDMIGKVTVNDKELPLIHVRLYDSTGKLIDSTLTDDFGNFKFKAEPNEPYDLVANDDQNHKGSKSIVTDNYLMVQEFNYRKDVGVIKIVFTEQQIYKVQENTSINKFMVHYALDKYEFDTYDRIVLDSLIRNLQTHPNAFAIIGSFTDCAEGIAYNIALSERRSKAVINYLVANNISLSRIVENHYGEEYLIGGCLEVGDGYQEKRNIVNRRTEIYIMNNKDRKWKELNEDKNLKFNIYSSIEIFRMKKYE